MGVTVVGAEGWRWVGWVVGCAVVTAREDVAGEEGTEEGREVEGEVVSL